MPNFIAVPFTFDSALAASRTTVSAKFSYQPNAGTAGYTLTGPNGENPAIVSDAVGTAYGEVILSVADPLAGGTWTLTVDAQVTTDITLVPCTPANHTFLVVDGPAVFLPFQGVDQTAAVFLRSVVPQSMKGPAWDALIQAMAVGSEQPAWNNAVNVFDSLFLSSALDYYLNRRAADLGLERPTEVSIDDESWRKLVIAVSSDKLTVNAIVEVLTIFYGVESTHARILTQSSETYGLVDGDILTLTFDGLDVVEVVFDAADFTDISQATAQEVTAVLSRAFLERGMTHFAKVEVDSNGYGNVGIYSGTLGLRGSVMSDAGQAQATLDLPTTRSSLLGQARASYARSLGPQSIEVVFPATISIVARGLNLATYLSDGSFEAGEGPYLSEGIDKGLAVTAEYTTLTAEVLKDHQYTLLRVSDATDIPEGAGYLVLGYGYSYQTGPVPYLGRAGAQALAMDPTYNFTSTVPAGADVRWLDGKEAPTPGIGQFWLTSTPEGRLAAMGFVDFITAAGYDLKKTVVYPSDIGLGNEGAPTSGSPKLSDIVRVFGGDELDEEIPALRQET